MIYILNMHDFDVALLLKFSLSLSIYGCVIGSLKLHLPVRFALFIQSSLMANLHTVSACESYWLLHPVISGILCLL